MLSKVHVLFHLEMHMGFVFKSNWFDKIAEFVLLFSSCLLELIYSSIFFAKLGHGDYSAANTKVLRMVNTLTVDNEAKQTIEALRTELQKTKEKLQAVEELKSQSGISTVPCMTMLCNFSNLYFLSVP